MVIEIPRNPTKKQLEEIKKKLKKIKRKSIAKHFGALKRGIDGLAYQKKIRDE